MPGSLKLTPPPEKLIPDLHASINAALATLQPDERGALVMVGTSSPEGPKFNAAVVARCADGWAVQAWIGKAWGASAEGGAVVMKTW